MKKLLALSLILALFSPLLRAQGFPEPMQPPRLVNDFTKLFSQSEAENLESKLLAFNNSTSSQIFVVTVPTLNGYEPNDYTTQLAEKWKVGVKGKDNGVMILVKPKSADEKGYVYIAVGYGLEGVLTDLQANQIVDIEMIPRFRQNDYAGGIDAAVNVIMKITSGEFTADQYLNQSTARKKKSNPILGLIIMAIILSVLFGGKSRMNRQQGIGGSGLPLLLLMGMMGGRGNGGSFGGFSSGGGFGGGFGGGGGGSFGGGGAGGSW